jgi:hypothetical protein
MCNYKRFPSILMCIAALALASCGTTGSSEAVAVAPVSPVVIPSSERMPIIGTQVTVGTLTDPCSLGLDDPWWIDHGGRAEFHRRCG